MRSPPGRPTTGPRAAWSRSRVPVQRLGWCAWPHHTMCVDVTQHASGRMTRHTPPTRSHGRTILGPALGRLRRRRLWRRPRRAGRGVVRDARHAVPLDHRRRGQTRHGGGRGWPGDPAGDRQLPHRAQDRHCDPGARAFRPGGRPAVAQLDPVVPLSRRRGAGIFSPHEWPRTATRLEFLGVGDGAGRSPYRQPILWSHWRGVCAWRALGVILAAQLPVAFGVGAMLPLLSALNVLSAWQLRRLGAAPGNHADEWDDPPPSEPVAPRYLLVLASIGIFEMMGFTLVEHLMN